MYTRHFNIPKNYNGVRFTQSDDGITVKEHRPNYDSGVKTSHSPLYNRKRPDDGEKTEITDTSPVEIAENEECAEAEDTEKCVLCKDDIPSENDISAEQKRFNLPIKEILNSIDREDALLICLILLIAAENDKNNNSILTMLSLLLLKR